MDWIDTILFDWDGTLIDSAKAAFFAFRSSLSQLGIPVEFEVYERIYSPNWYRMYQSLQLPREKWEQADDLWIRHYEQDTPGLVPGGEHVLHTLTQRGYCLGIVTSGSHARVRRELKTLGLGEIFRIVICSEDVANKKPDPEGLKEALRRLNKGPEACCYVGDSPDDVEMGKRAHMCTIGILGAYPGSKTLPSSHPDFYFESIIQLLEHFDTLPQPMLL